jgi:hypothetical protein
MPQPGVPRGSEEAPPLRCSRCGAAVEPTRHTRTAYAVGYYLLHTGRTVEASLVRRDDEAPIVYRRLLEAIDVVSCPACFAEPGMRRVWESFGDEGMA